MMMMIAFNSSKNTLSLYPQCRVDLFKPNLIWSLSIPFTFFLFFFSRTNNSKGKKQLLSTDLILLPSVYITTLYSYTACMYAEI